MRLLLCTIIYLVGVVQAAPTTNTTTTSDGLEAPSFTNRTLWNIVSSCVLTLFACNYSAIHPNIPSPKDSLVRVLRRRLGIMIMALIAPELIVVWAMRQWVSARHVTNQFKKSGYFNVSQLQVQHENHELAEVPVVPVEQLEDHNQLLAAPAEDEPSVSSVVHSTPVSTSRHRGARALPKPFKTLFKAYVSEQSEDHAWTQTHSFFVLMGGLMLYVDGEPYHTLQPDQVLTLIRKGCIDAPSITAKQIHDKSKGNVISKGLIILQVAWFVLQLISRAIYHLNTTKLETGTLAFAVLSFLTYALWWNKPLDVQCPHPVYWKSTELKPEDYVDDVIEDDEDDDDEDAEDTGDAEDTHDAEDTEDAGDAEDAEDAEDDEDDEDDEDNEDNVLTAIHSAVLFPLGELIGSRDIPTPKLRVPTFDGSIELEDSDVRILMFAGILMATIFGGIHCIAWFFAFPTYLEQVLWRVGAVAITCTPWLETLLYYFFGEMNNRSNFKFDDIVVVSLYIFGMLYIAGRAILLVLMFTTLRNLPPGAYMAVSWISFVPHL